MTVRGFRPRLLSIGAALLFVCGAAIAPGINAALAPPDAPTPPGAEELAAQIRDRFDSAMEVPLPAYRVAIREWQERGGSYLVRVEVYDLVFGFSPRLGYAIAGCWRPGSRGLPFSGGWADDDVQLADVLFGWNSIPAICP